MLEQGITFLVNARTEQCDLPEQGNVVYVLTIYCIHACARQHYIAYMLTIDSYVRLAICVELLFYGSFDCS